MTKRNCLTVLMMCLLCFPALAKKKKVSTPDQLAGATIVKKADVQRLLKEGAKIFDVRKKLEFKEAHVDGATYLPYKEKSKKVADFDMSKDKFDISKLPAKDSKVIFYCNGKTCWKSYKASKTAIKNGWKNVYWFRGGYPEWSK